MTDLCHDPSSSIVCDDKVCKIDRKFHEEVSSASNWIIDESIELQHHNYKEIIRWYQEYSTPGGTNILLLLSNIRCLVQLRGRC